MRDPIVVARTGRNIRALSGAADLDASLVQELDGQLQTMHAIARRAESIQEEATMLYLYALKRYDEALMEEGLIKALSLSAWCSSEQEAVLDALRQQYAADLQRILDEATTEFLKRFRGGGGA